MTKTRTTTRIVAAGIALLVFLAVSDRAKSQTQPESLACIGDCDASGNVTITDLVLMVRVAMNNVAVDNCTVGDVDVDGTITVDEVIRAVNAAFLGCPQPPTPTPTATPSPTATPTASGEFLCSAGLRDGEPCYGDNDCAPDGVCIIAQSVCDGGESDGVQCYCGGGSCSLACSDLSYMGVCQGGVNAGEYCFLDTDCAGGRPCVPSQKMCLGGDLRGRPCLRNDQCRGAQCGASGKVCCGGTMDGSACIENSNCPGYYDESPGTCEMAGSECVHGLPTRTPIAVGTPLPTPAPVAFAARLLITGADDPNSVAVADANGDGLVDLIIANAGSDSISVLLGQPDHRFVLSTDSPFSAGGSVLLFIAAADLNGDGHVDLVTANRDSRSLSILLGQADHHFITAPGSPIVFAGGAPSSVAIADLNDDGLLDLATAGQLNVLWQQLDHTFVLASGSPFATGTECTASVAVADINHDQLPDLVTSCNDKVSVLVQHSDHGFAPASGSPFRIGDGLGAVSVAVGDFNNDGRLDLVTANGSYGSRPCNCVSVLLQQPDGSFAAAGGSPFSVRAIGPSSVAVADLNGDGLQDIITANGSSVSVLLGQPNVTFLPALGSPIAVGAVSVAVADVDGDGWLDLVAPNGGTVSVLLGRAETSFVFAPGSPFRVGMGHPLSIAVTDLNGDDLVDLATANAASDDVTVLLGQPNHNLLPAPGSPFATGAGYPHALAVGDFNADGLQDIATTNGYGREQDGKTVSVLLQQPTHSFVAMRDSPFNIGFAPLAITATDVNGDRLADLLTTFGYNYDNGVNVWLAQPDRSFAIAAGSPFDVASFSPNAIGVADVDGDDLPDVVTANGNGDNVSVLLGQPNHTFAPAPGSPFAGGGTYSPDIVLEDINADWLLDIVTLGSNVSVLLGQTDHTFAPAPGSPFMVGSDPSTLAVTDLNGDGLLDLVTGNRDGEVSVALQRADHSFICTPWSPLRVGARGYYFSIRAGDLNGDGRPDIATAGSRGIVGLFQVNPLSETPTPE